MITLIIFLFLPQANEREIKLKQGYEDLMNLTSNLNVSLDDKEHKIYTLTQEIQAHQQNLLEVTESLSHTEGKLEYVSKQVDEITREKIGSPNSPLITLL